MTTIDAILAALIKFAAIRLDGECVSKSEDVWSSVQFWILGNVVFCVEISESVHGDEPATLALFAANVETSGLYPSRSDRVSVTPAQFRELLQINDANLRRAIGRGTEGLEFPQYDQLDRAEGALCR